MRYEVVSETHDTEQVFGVYDTVTGAVLCWYSTETEAESNIPTE